MGQLSDHVNKKENCSSGLKTELIVAEDGLSLNCREKSGVTQATCLSLLLFCLSVGCTLKNTIMLEV